MICEACQPSQMGMLAWGKGQLGRACLLDGEHSLEVHKHEVEPRILF
jgi:hypothetical protein